MQEGLSIEGVLTQTRRVVMARWPGLLVVAAGWSLAAWLTRDLATTLMNNGVIDPDSPWLYATVLADSFVGAVGTAAVIGIVVRTGLPGRPIPAVALHGAIAAATVFAALLVYGWGELLLREILANLAWGQGPMTTPIAYAAGPVLTLYQIGLFVVFGMAVPAALERPVPPWTAAAVSLKLTEGRRFWLTIIAVVWSMATISPVFALAMASPGAATWTRPLQSLVQTLTALGIGVLYLELRRLRTTMAAAPGIGIGD